MSVRAGMSAIMSVFVSKYDRQYGCVGVRVGVGVGVGVRVGVGVLELVRVSVY